MQLISPTFYEIVEVQQHGLSSDLLITCAPSRIMHPDADQRAPFFVVVTPERMADIASAVLRVLGNRSLGVDLATHDDLDARARGGSIFPRFEVSAPMPAGTASPRGR